MQYNHFKTPGVTVLFCAIKQIYCTTQTMYCYVIYHPETVLAGSRRPIAIVKPLNKGSDHLKHLSHSDRHSVRQLAQNLGVIADNFDRKFFRQNQLQNVPQNFVQVNFLLHSTCIFIIMIM